MGTFKHAAVNQIKLYCLCMSLGVSQEVRRKPLCDVQVWKKLKGLYGDDKKDTIKCPPKINEFEKFPTIHQ